MLKNLKVSMCKPYKDNDFKEPFAKKPSRGDIFGKTMRKLKRCIAILLSVCFFVYLFLKRALNPSLTSSAKDKYPFPFRCCESMKTAQKA